MLIEPTSAGLYCAAGDFYIDPWAPVDRAVITHAHGDHLRPGSQSYLCTDQSRPIVLQRLGPATPLTVLRYGDSVHINGVRVSLHPAGHILGSAMIHLTAAGPDRERTLTFSGDMGRRGLPILKPTGEVPPADLLVCESTYGNRLHRSFSETVEKLYSTIRDTIAKDGKILIPAFSPAAHS